MTTLNKRTATMVAVGALTLGAGVGVAGLASADPSASPSAPSSASPSTGNLDSSARPGRGFGFRGEGMASTLAEKLGVDEAKVTEALQSLHDERRAADRPADGVRPDRAALEAELAKGLADKLGVSQDEVTQALEELRTERLADRQEAFQARLDDAVKAGTLTQAEADAVLKAAEKGVIGMGGRGPR